MEQTTPKRQKRSQRDYTLGFKLSVIEQVEKGEMTYKQAQSIYGIQGRSTVLVWLRKHGTLDWSTPCERMMPKAKEPPIQKIKRLETELEDERLRNVILNEMIDVADKQHGVSIRKKYCSKASQGFKPKAQ